MVTYGISLLFGIPLYFKEYMSPETLVIFMTILPASGVSIARLYKYKKNDKHIILNYVIIADFLLPFLNSNIILGCLIFSVILSLFIFTKEYKNECKD